jgi:hypothetical protein
VISLLLLFAQTPVDFADYLYSANDWRRAALEYERIAFLSLQDSALASYSLLRSGEALLKIDEPVRAAKLYSFGMDNLSADRERFIYGLMRAEFAQDNYGEAGRLSASLKGTTLAENAAVYNSFALAFAGEAEAATLALSALEASSTVDSTIALINTPLRHRSFWVSAGLSTVLPGAGQAYCGRWSDAWHSFSLTALLTGAGMYYFFFSPDTSTGNTVKAVVFTSLGGLFWLGNVYGAVNSTLDYNEYQERKRTEQLRNLLDQFDLEPAINRP